MDKYLTAKRIASIKQYLADCANGMESPAAWNAHKARMQEPDSPVKHQDKQMLWAWSCEPCEYKSIAVKQWSILADQKDEYAKQ
jgi:hypothetical protein